MKLWKGDIINMGAERFSETVAASISGGVGVFVYVHVWVWICANCCVSAWQRNEWCQSVHVNVWEREKVTALKKNREREWRKRNIFHTSPNSLELIIHSFSKTVNLYGGAILGCSHKKLRFTFHHTANKRHYFFLLFLTCIFFIIRPQFLKQFVDFRVLKFELCWKMA